MNKALVGSIGRYSLHDGPGIRSTVFFKGCPLHCPWCHNPEFISPEPEVAFYPRRCIGCGECVEACPEEAASLDLPGRIHRGTCTGCGLCAQACPAKALEPVGTAMDQGELMEILLRDRIFYDVSGGGVTLSGGEPTSQMDFITGLLEGLKKEGIHTAIQTNGLFTWEDFSRGPLEHLDLILFDIKIADPGEHRRITGMDNEIILENLERLLSLHPDKRVVARIPVIPGYTATGENLSAISKWLKETGAKYVSLLPYHPFGLSKAENIGRRVDASLPTRAMPRTELEEWSGLFAWAEME